MDSRNLNDMRVIDLKKELELRGLTKSGSKKELVDRLRAYIEKHEASSNKSVPVREDELPPLQVGFGEENEFVKNYLQQRQQLLTQQMEARKRFEAEEAIQSQSDCEASGGEIETQSKQVPDEPSGSEPEKETVKPCQSVDPGAYQQHVEPVKQADEHESDTTVSPEKDDNEMEHQVAQPVVDGHIITNSTDHVQSSVSLCTDQVDFQEHNKMECEQDLPHKSRTCERDSQPSSRSSSEGSRSVASSGGSRSRSGSKASSRERSRSHSSDSHSSQSKSERPGMRSRSPDRWSSKSEDRSQPGNRSRSSRSRDGSRSRSAERPVSDHQDRSLTKLQQAPRAELSDSNISGKNEASLHDDTNDDEDQVMQSVVSTICESSMSVADIVKGCDAVEPSSETSSDNMAGKESKVASRTSTLAQDTVAEEKPETVVQHAEGAKLISFANEVRPNRKRRWGSSTVQPSQPTVNISTDSLKGLIPEIDTTTLSLDLPLDLGEDSDTLSKELSAPVRAVIVTPATDEPAASKIRRTVVLDSAACGEGDSVGVSKLPVGDSETSSRVVKPPASEISKKQEGAQLRATRTLSLVEDPVVGRDREPSPARCPASNVVHVTGLTRPYTLPQLKELLGRTGSLQPDGFWIDNIKSHCYVVFETTEQAVATRQALHGKRWPASNPKILGIEFGTMAEFESHKQGKATAVGPTTAQAVELANKPAGGLQQDRRDPDRLVPGMEPTKDSSHDQNHDRDRKKLSPLVAGRPQVKDKQGAVPVREWDRHKVRQSRSTSRDRRRDSKSRSENKDRKENNRHVQDKARDDKRGRGRSDKTDITAKVQEEPPAKLLDDLFRKTKAMPCIYWLPLTDEQVAEKQAALLAEEQKRAEADRIADLERLKRREERERQEQAARAADRDARQQLQRRKFTEEEDLPRRRARSRSGGRRDRH